MTDLSPATSRTGSFRPEIEGLRSVAFMLVAVFHIWFNRVSGGVDVFFTVAGFLVTTTLLGHVRRYGRIRPGVYFGRLARRLLPAAITVLAATAVATRLILPEATWRDVLEQIAASALYFENWYLGLNAVDYLAVDTTRSPVQHFWAMSIQGQFYVLWFVLFVVLAAVAARTRVSVRRLAAAAIVLLVVLSFVFSVVDTHREQELAYFSTFTRVWEFGLGGLLALGVARLRMPVWLAATASWVALAVILGTGLALPVADLFPGAVALLPVLSACTLIATGRLDGGRGASRLLASRPLVWLGGLGYGVYLWHWPLMIFTLHLQGVARASVPTGLVIIASALVLAWLTNRLVERPVLALAESSPSRRLVPTLALVTAVLLIGVGGTVKVSAIDRADEKAQAASQKHPCFGARALERPADCPLVDPTLPVVPKAPSRDIDLRGFGGRCASNLLDSRLKLCSWGDPDAATRVAVLGNSHAAVWLTSLIAIAEQQGWRIDAYTKFSCAITEATRDAPEGPEPGESCDTWNVKLARHLASVPRYDYVFTSALGQFVDFTDRTTGLKGIPAAVAGYHRTWRPILDRGSEIIAIRDYPRSSLETIDCGTADPEAGCGRRQRNALVPEGREALLLAARSTTGVRVLDMQRWFCLDGFCPSVIGNVQVYRDAGHFTKTYARTLTPFLRRELEEQVGLDLGRPGRRAD